jgi:small multidrug resistance pump
MEKTTLAVLVTFAFSVVGVVGDYFLKLASTRDQPLNSGWFYLGFALYASTAFGWVFVMRHLKLGDRKHTTHWDVPCEITREAIYGR